MGALADELVDVLGDAFSAPQADLQTGMSRVGGIVDPTSINPASTCFSFMLPG